MASAPKKGDKLLTERKSHTRPSSRTSLPYPIPQRLQGRLQTTKMHQPILQNPRLWPYAVACIASDKDAERLGIRTTHNSSPLHPPPRDTHTHLTATRCTVQQTLSHQRVSPLSLDTQPLPTNQAPIMVPDSPKPNTSIPGKSLLRMFRIRPPSKRMFGAGCLSHLSPPRSLG
jgi:hypothetical protein